MNFTRNLRKGMSGDDVLYAKQKLVELGYLHAATKTTFGTYTLNAVKKFQTANGLEVDGIIGKLTWAALFGETVASEPIVSIPGYEVLDRFSDEIKNAIAVDLETVSEIRRAVCLDALQFAIDPYNPPQYPLSLYIRGGNLYNKDLTVNTITAARIRSGAARQPEFYDGGREEFMLEVVDNNPDTVGADCSGQNVGLMRKHKIYDAGFDATANTLFNSHCTRTDDPKPGDWPWKSGHIGLYVGGGRAIEHVGGAYGCQLTKISDRRCYNFLDGKLHRMGAWEAFGDPKRY
ncbi:MAG: peptidoglycan-binding domain-containing protein [Clostridiaceae bacterium]